MIGLLLLVLAASPDAFHLEVVREGATRACPASDVRARVVALLGRDPFVDVGDEALKFEVTTRSGPRWTAVIRTSGKGTRVGIRKLEVPTATCGALDETVALALALAIDPLGATQPEPPPDRPGSTGLEPDVDTVNNPASTTSSERSRGREAGGRAARLGIEPSKTVRPNASEDVVGWRLGVQLSAGLAPDVALAPELAVTVRDGPWSFELGGRVHTSASRVGGLMTAVVVWTLYADACLGGLARVCADFEGGAYRADAVRGDTRPHLAPGLALKLVAPAAAPSTPERGVGVEVTVRVSAPLWRQRWDSGGEAVWAMPAWIVGLGFGVKSGGRGSWGL